MPRNRNSLRHFKIARRLWEPEVESGCAQISGDPEIRRTVFAILSGLHNRHVGIGAQMAARLAPLLIDPAAIRLARPPWDKVRDRLGFSLDMEIEMSRSEYALTRSMLFALRPGYFLYQIVEPLLRDAIRELGVNCLFCGDPDSDQPPPMPYGQYCQSLEEAVAKRAAIPKHGEPRSAFDLFWKDHALVLDTMSREHPLRSFPRTPEISPLSRAAFHRLHLKDRPDEARIQSSPSWETAEVQTTSRMEGVGSIKLTRSPEDIPDMLFSELLNPDEIMLDRLYNSGYLARQRHSPREKRRDVLICGVLPSGFENSPVKDTARSAWFETMSRFSWQLLKGELARSEIRWIEGDQFGRFRSHTALLSVLAEFSLGSTEGYPPKFREFFTKMLNWLPDFLDSGIGFENPDPRLFSEDDFQPGEDQFVAWLQASWRAQTDNPGWLLDDEDFGGERSPMTTGSGGINFSDFAHVIAMIFVPHDWESNGGDHPVSPLNALSLRSILQVQSRTEVNVIRITMPREVHHVAGWRVDTTIPFGERQGLFAEVEPGGKTDAQSCLPEEVADRLQRRWLNLLRKEVSGG